jgi:motility quorum-sensing regulator/GCU-specific mRNA interferase toxin
LVRIPIEKWTPHCKLSLIPALVAAGKVKATFTALAGGAALGLDFEGMVGIVMALTPADFHKSMTTHADHRIWQDVYRPQTQVGEVYLKLTIIEDVLIVSFKEL